MARRLLVVGARGLLGQACLASAAAHAWEAVGVDIDEIDITDAASVERIMEREQPTAVVNCAAYTDVEGAETPEGRAIADRVNGTGPGILAHACLRHASAFIHLSTDYVFSGTSEDGALESDVPTVAMNAYGETKRIGELQVIAAAGGVTGSDFQCMNPQICIVRTSWLFGASAKNFVSKIAARAKAEGRISVDTDEIGSPTFVRDLAECLLWMLEAGSRSGIYHATGDGHCSRFDFAAEVLHGLGITAEMTPILLAAYPRKAHIAHVSVLQNTKMPHLRPWKEMVQSYCEEAEGGKMDTL
jgi:dTDP-4-dehydrorhamnose reductase